MGRSTTSTTSSRSPSSGNVNAPVWGLVGTGRMTRQFARAILEVGQRVGAVAGRTTASAAAFAAELGSDPLAGETPEALVRAGVDLAYIASPNDVHGEHIALLARAGIPVLCEKPLAATAAAARAIRDAADPAGPRIGVAFQYRQHPAHRRAREIILSGELGELRGIDVAGCLPALEVPAWYDDPRVAGGGILPMTGVHRVDLVRFITGREVRSVSAVTAHHRGASWDDSATVAAGLDGDVGCAFQFGLDMPFGDDRVAVHGTTGSLVLEDTMSQWWSTSPGSLTLRTAAGVARETFDDVDTYALQALDFASDGESIAGLDDAVAAAEITEAIYRSAVEGGRVAL